MDDIRPLWFAKTTADFEINDLAALPRPQEGCPHTMSISAGGPPAYWLGEGYFDGP
jgi:hypothetical protein